MLPQQWCDCCVKETRVEHLHKRVTLERAESTLPLAAFDSCFSKTSGSASGVMADETAKSLALVDVDTGYLKAFHAPVKTVPDFLVEGGRRFMEQFFRRRVRLRCAGDRATVTLVGKFEGASP